MICKRNKFILLISFTNHGLIACILLGINICSEIEIPTGSSLATILKKLWEFNVCTKMKKPQGILVIVFSCLK